MTDEQLQQHDTEAIARAIRSAGADLGGHVATAYVATSGALVVVMDTQRAYRLTVEPLDGGEVPA